MSSQDGGGTDASSAVRAGETVTLSEADYRYGVGAMRLRVFEVLGTVPFPDGEYVHVRGVELRTDGNPRGEREAYLRLQALVRLRGR